jgi:putative membrane protein
MWGPGFGGGMFLWPLVLLLVIAGLVYWATRRGKEDEGEDRAMRLLREQYAKGEIDDEEFEERRSKLMSS